MKAYKVYVKTTYYSGGDEVVSDKVIKIETPTVFYANSRAHLFRILKEFHIEFDKKVIKVID